MKLKNFKLACLLVFISGCTDSKVKESSILQASSISTLKEYKNKALQVYTAKDTDLRLTKTSDQIFKDKVQPLETEVAIFINPNKTFQKYLGIGGAITDASSEVFATLDNDQQNKLLQSLFGKEGDRL
jgi:glucosylceramidase